MFMPALWGDMWRKATPLLDAHVSTTSAPDAIELWHSLHTCCIKVARTCAKAVSTAGDMAQYSIRQLLSEPHLNLRGKSPNQKTVT